MYTSQSHRQCRPSPLVAMASQEEDVEQSAEEQAQQEPDARDAADDGASRARERPDACRAAMCTPVSAAVPQIAHNPIPTNAAAADQQNDQEPGADAVQQQAAVDEPAIMAIDDAANAEHADEGSNTVAHDQSQVISSFTERGGSPRPGSSEVRACVFCGCVP